MDNVATSATIGGVTIPSKIDMSQVTVGFEFEFVCPENTWSKLSTEVHENLGRVGEVSRLYATHAKRPDRLTAWHITGDSSISDYDAETEVGVELVSPPIPVSSMKETLDKVWKVLSSVGGRTNKTCGLHMTVFHPRIKSNLDPIKMALFLGDEKILSRFNRSENEYARNFMEQVYENLHGSDSDDFLDKGFDESSSSRTSSYDEDDEDFGDPDEDLVDTLTNTDRYTKVKDVLLARIARTTGPLDRNRARLLSFLSENDPQVEAKYYSINLGKVAQNLVEYRAIGGDYLGHNVSEIFNIGRRLVFSILVATGTVASPAIEKAYSSFLYKRLNEGAHKKAAQTAKNLSTSGYRYTATVAEYPNPKSMYDRIRIELQYSVTPIHAAGSASVISAEVMLSILLGENKSSETLIGRYTMYGGTTVDTKTGVVGGPSNYSAQIAVPVRNANMSFTDRTIDAEQIAWIISSIRTIRQNIISGKYRDQYLAIGLEAHEAGYSNQQALTIARAVRESLAANSNSLPKFLAELAVKRMDPKQYQERAQKRGVSDKERSIHEALRKRSLADQAANLKLGAVTDNIMNPAVLQRIADPFNHNISKVYPIGYPVGVNLVDHAGICASLVRILLIKERDQYVSLLTSKLTDPTTVYPSYQGGVPTTARRDVYDAVYQLTLLAGSIQKSVAAPYGKYAVPPIPKIYDAARKFIEETSTLYYEVKANLQEEFKPTEFAAQFGSAWSDSSVAYDLWSAVIPAVVAAKYPQLSAGVVVPASLLAIPNVFSSYNSEVEWSSALPKLTGIKLSRN